MTTSCNDSSPLLSSTDQLASPCQPPNLASNASAKKKLILSIVLCLIFFVIELTAGLYASSLAILSDSFHLLSDVVGFAISLGAIVLSQRPSTKLHSWGYHRAEIVGAILSTFLIWMLTLGLVCF